MPWIPFVKNGFFGSKAWTPLVKGNGLTAGGDEPEPPVPVPTYTTVAGFSPLALLNAIQLGIRNLTQFGKCTQASTPTPDAPVDIVCNNGVLRYGALGRNLCDPSAANTVLEYYINKADGEVKPSPPNFMFAGYMPVVGGKTYVAYGRAKTGNDLSDYNRVAWYDSTKTWISGADYTQNRIAVVTAPANAAYARFSCNPTGTTTTVVTQEIVDSYNWTFCEGTAEITPFVPFVGGIYTDGNPEVLTVIQNQNTDQTIVKATLASADTDVRYNTTSSCIVAPVKPNTTYTIGFLTKPTGGAIFRAATTKTKVTSSQTSVASIAYDLDKNDYEPKTLNSGEDAAWMYVQLSNTMSDDDFASIIIQEGTSIHNPQTASVVDLFSAGNYKDTQDIISGAIHRNVHVIVCDGTEDWRRSMQGSMYRYRLQTTDGTTAAGATRYNVFCSHFADTMEFSVGSCVYATSGKNLYCIPIDQTIDDAEKWKAWVAAQYAAGTPLIIIYPIDNGGTESVTARPLNTSAGDNTVSVTANVSPISLECEYANGFAE